MTFALKKKKKIELRPFLGWVGLVRGGWQVRLAPCDCCSGLRRGSGRGRRSVPDSLLLSHRTWAPPLPPTHHEPPAAPPQPLIRQVTGRPTPTLHPATSQTSSKTSTPTSSLLESARFLSVTISRDSSQGGNNFQLPAGTAGC